MKKITLMAALLGSAYFANAQVGIGTPTPATSAMLDITATNKGVLIPRVALTTNDDQTTVSGPVTSLLVYNTNPSADAVAPEKKVTPGFYYWNVNKWERIVSQTDLTNAIEEANAELDDIISLLQTAYPSNNLDGSTTTGSELGGGMVYTPASGTTPAKIEYVYYNGTSYVKQDLSDMLADIIDPANGSVFYNNIGTEAAPEFVFQYWDASLNNGEGGFTTITISDLVQANESKTTVLEFPADSGKFYYISEAAIQENNGIVPTSPFTDANNQTLINGVVYIDVPASVSTNFETILDQTTTIAIPGQTNQYYTVEQVIQNLIEEYSDANLPGTMVYIPGTNLTEASFTYTLADGTQSAPVTFTSIVKANESKTGFITGIDANGGTVIYYVGEDYLSTNEFPTADDANGWATTPSTKPATITILDVPQAVSTNFETILDQTTTIAIPGQTDQYYTVEQVIQNIANSNGTNVGYTTVAIPADATTGQENVPANSLFYINNEGLKVVLPLGDIVYQGITQLNDTQVNDVKTKLGDKIVTNSSVVTGDTYNGKAVRKGIYSTTITANEATTSGVILDVAASEIISITVKYNGGLVANVTDLTVSDTAVGFNIGTGKMYQVLGSSDITAEVIVEFAVQ